MNFVELVLLTFKIKAVEPVPHFFCPVIFYLHKKRNILIQDVSLSDLESAKFESFFE
jgi:hypothetical protein